MVDPDFRKWRVPDADGRLRNPLKTPSPATLLGYALSRDPDQLAREQEVRLRHAELNYEKIYWRLMAVPTTGEEAEVCRAIHIAFSDKELRYVMARNRDR